MKEIEIVTSSVTYKNGGIEQGILQIIEDRGDMALEPKDKQRLEYLKSLPQNRTEILRTSTIVSPADPSTEEKGE